MTKLGDEASIWRAVVFVGHWVEGDIPLPDSIPTEGA